MAPRAKRRRENTSAPPSLPAELVLEIVALSDPVVLVRCAAACKLLRRDILNQSFIRRVCHQAAPCILANLYTDNDKPFTLVHPATPAVASFCDAHLFPFLSRCSAGLFSKYTVVMSRHSLLLLRRASIKNRPYSIINPPDFDPCTDLCVYDPMSGTRSFLSCAPKVGGNSIYSSRQYVLLTAADGIDCSFQVLVADLGRDSIKVRTASPCGTWGPITYVSNRDYPCWSIKWNSDTVVLRGGVLHWLAYNDKQILTYDLGPGKLGLVKLPPTNCYADQLHLARSSDGKLLKLHIIEGFMMSVGLQVPGGTGWSVETVIDMEEKLRALHPYIPPIGPDKLIVFDSSENWSAEVVLLRVPGPRYHDAVTVFDLKSKDMHVQEGCSSLLEMDLQSRIRNMKIFS